MPQTGIHFKISHKQFFRPDSTYDEIDAVYPDVEIFRQLEDIINNKDSQMEKLMEYIHTDHSIVPHRER
jgi:hypothetical protein